MYEAIDERFDRPIIVRSSTLVEDGWEHSNPGCFESILDLPPGDEASLADAIKRVIDTYDDNPNNLLGQFVNLFEKPLRDLHDQFDHVPIAVVVRARTHAWVVLEEMSLSPRGDQRRQETGTAPL